MIIWGTKGRIKDVGSGQFLCPSCRAVRMYKHKHAARYFTLYFIPLFKIKDLGEFVECQTCGGTFKTTVLQLMTKAAATPKVTVERAPGPLPDDSHEDMPRG
ncbi:MAG TPA: zinc-ribbon domain-containing protein [Aggregatilineales bacterium]|nr:zinc-ribbon domain-containing protein [Aggregatilineales bacterium]